MVATFRLAVSERFTLSDYAEHALPFLSPFTGSAGVELVTVAPRDGGYHAEDLAGVDAFILVGHPGRFGAESIPADGRLAVVIRYGVGFDEVDVAACTAAGVALVTTPDGIGPSMAVAAVTFILALAHRVLDKDRLSRAGAEGWAEGQLLMGSGVGGKVLGLLGLGNIGAEVARLLTPFGMTVLACDPFLTPEELQRRGLAIELVDKPTLFTRSDFVSIHCPLEPSTVGAVSTAELALMKPTAFLVNTARGPIVDAEPLAEALHAGSIAGAGIDVFDTEPPPP